MWTCRSCIRLARQSTRFAPTSQTQNFSSHTSSPLLTKTNHFASNYGHLASRNLTTSSDSRPKRIVVGVTGATGTVYAIRMLEILREVGIETHLVMSKWALATMKYETDRSWDEVQALATKSYALRDMAAPSSSGSFLHDGMIIVPCSMKTLAAVRAGYCDDLISRSADVCLKERRRLVLAVRETPLSAIHLDNMAFLERAGATIFPPVPAFYTRPKSVQDLIDQSVGRMLDCFGIHLDNFERWESFRKA
ncbi:phenylacrylic acid decarboxylase [Phyllosticta citribraziliensis]|uniref:Flavin prenyltransferase PAD1, mitochondrial n=1 Tax=Phyllosticta citribraziliensis TaxID=989973 RepID=A0ABR1M5S5_9PEZI